MLTPNPLFPEPRPLANEESCNSGMGAHEASSMAWNAAAAPLEARIFENEAEYGSSGGGVSLVSVVRTISVADSMKLARYTFRESFICEPIKLA